MDAHQTRKRRGAKYRVLILADTKVYYGERNRSKVSNRNRTKRRGSRVRIQADEAERKKEDLRWTLLGLGCLRRDIVARMMMVSLLLLLLVLGGGVSGGDDGGGGGGGWMIKLGEGPGQGGKKKGGGRRRRRKREAADWPRRGEESKWRFRRDVQTWTNFTPASPPPPSLPPPVPPCLSSSCSAALPLRKTSNDVFEKKKPSHH